MLFLSCKKEEGGNCFSSLGEIKKETRAIPFFDKIDLDDNVEIVLYQSIDQEVVVQYGENVLDGIITDVQNNTLFIRNENRCNFLRTYNYKPLVFIAVPDLKKIYWEGGGKIRSAGPLNFPSLYLETEGGGSDVDLELNCDSLFAVLHTGVSNLNLKGSAQYAYFYSVGNSIFHAENFPANAVHVNNGSTGDFHVRATNTLLVEIRSYSSVFYYGTPAQLDIQRFHPDGQVISQ